MGGIQILEILFLIASMGAFVETGKRRGTDSWPFIVVALFGFFVLPTALMDGAAPFVSWGWIGLVYGSLFVIGGRGQRLEDSWQCESCLMFNPPTTLICPCGQAAASARTTIQAAPTPSLILGIWPRIRNQHDANWAIRQGILAASLVVGICGFESSIALLTGSDVSMTLGAFAIVLVLYIPIIIGLQRRFWLAPIVGAALQFCGTAMVVGGRDWLSPILSFVLLLFFIGSIRGTFMLLVFEDESASPRNQNQDA